MGMRNDRKGKALRAIPPNVSPGNRLGDAEGTPERYAGRPSETAMDVLFLLVAIACLLTALLAALGTLGLSPAIEKIADRVIKGA